MSIVIAQYDDGESLVDDVKSATQRPRTTRQFLVHIDSDLIRQVKILAIDRNVTASRLVQEAIASFLLASREVSAATLPGDAL
jgi:hypothetical protein